MDGWKLHMRPAERMGLGSCGGRNRPTVCTDHDCHRRESSLECLRVISDRDESSDETVSLNWVAAWCRWCLWLEL